MKDKPMQAERDSDFLPWTLAAIVVVIMTVAVRINANESNAPRPQVHDPDQHDQEPRRADRLTAHAPERA